MLTRRFAAAGIVMAAAATAAGGMPAGAATAARHFSVPLHVDSTVANQTGEPSIVVARDGTEYVVAPVGPGVRTPGNLGASGFGGSLVWRSDDRGRHWALLGSYDVPTGGGDTDIDVAPDGTLYASGLSYAACSTVGVSRDKGQTWLDDPIAGCGRMPVMNDRQWTRVVGGDQVWTVIGDTFGGSIDLIRSATTSPLVLPSSSLSLYTGGDYEWPGTIAVDQVRRTAYVVWNTTGAPDNCDQSSNAAACAPTAASTTVPDRIEVSVVHDGDTSAPAPVVIASRRFDSVDSFVSDAVDAAGNVYVVWSERHPVQQQTWTMLSVSRDRGRTWSAPARVQRAPNTTVYPWVTAGDAGRLVVSYYGTPGRGNSPQTVPSASRWQVWSSFSTDGGRNFVEYATTGTMQKGPICTGGTACTASSRNLLDFFETAADPQGCLVTAFADNSAGGEGAYVSYVRQTGGPGLRAAAPCR